MMNDLGALIVVGITAVVSFTLGHLVTARAVGALSVFSRTSPRKDEEELEESEIPAIYDEDFVPGRGGGSARGSGGPYTEPERQDQYDRSLSS